MVDTATISSKPLLSQIAEVVSASSSLIWPLIVIVVLWLLRHRLTEIITLAIRRIEGASDIEIGAVKIKGAIVSQQGDVLRGDTNELTLVDATLKLFDDRHNVYKEVLNICMLYIQSNRQNRRNTLKICVFLTCRFTLRRTGTSESLMTYLKYATISATSGARVNMGQCTS